MGCPLPGSSWECVQRDGVGRDPEREMGSDMEGETYSGDLEPQRYQDKERWNRPRDMESEKKGRQRKEHKHRKTQEGDTERY
jgi:hypothetical protein